MALRRVFVARKKYIEFVAVGWYTRWPKKKKPLPSHQ